MLAQRSDDVAAASVVDADAVAGAGNSTEVEGSLEGNGDAQATDAGSRKDVQFSPPLLTVPVGVTWAKVATGVSMRSAKSLSAPEQRHLLL